MDLVLLSFIHTLYPFIIHSPRLAMKSEPLFDKADAGALGATEKPAKVKKPKVPKPPVDPNGTKRTLWGFPKVDLLTPTENYFTGKQ